MTRVLLPVGDRGDESHPSGSGLHVLMQRHHQRQGQRRAQDLLCAYRDDPLTVPGECNALRLQNMLSLHWHNRQTICDRKHSFLSELLNYNVNQIWDTKRINRILQMHHSSTQQL